MKRKLTHFFSGFLACSAIVLMHYSTAALSSPPEILNHQVCVKTDSKDGTCLGYSLPYSGHTLEDYVQALDKEFSIEDRKKIARRREEYLSLLRSMLQTSDKQVKDEFFKKLSLKLTSPKDEKDNRQIAEFNTYILLDYLLNKGQEVYPSVAREKLNRFAHDLYTVIQGRFLDTTPNFHFLTQTSTIKLVLQLIKGANGRSTIKSRFNFIDNQDEGKIFVTFLIRGIQQNLNFHRHWRSIEATRWLINIIPELRTSRVLELGAGSGMQAHLLAMLGVDITATDIHPSEQYFTKVRRYSAEDAIRKFGKKYKVFLIEFPSWVINTTVNLITKLPADWTLIIVNSEKPLPSLSISGVEVQEFSSNKYLSPSVTKYENNKTVIRVYRKISTHQEL